MKPRPTLFPGIPTRPIRHGLLLGLFFLFAAAAPAQESWEHGNRGGRDQQPEEIQHLTGILHGLEQGMEALERLGAEEELHALARIADDVRGELERLHEDMRGGRPHGRALEGRDGRDGRDFREGRPGPGGRAGPKGRFGQQRETVMDQIETLKMALPALREAEKRDLAEMAEQGIHVRETLLEGRRDREARELREHAPDPGQEAEILMFSAHLLEDRFDDPRRAEDLRRNVHRLWGPVLDRAERDRGPHGDRMRQEHGDRMRQEHGDRMGEEEGDRMRQEHGDRMRQEHGDREREGPRDAAERLERLQDRIEALSDAVREIEAQLDRLQDESR